MQIPAFNPELFETFRLRKTFFAILINSPLKSGRALLSEIAGYKKEKENLYEKTNSLFSKLVWFRHNKKG